MVCFLEFCFLLNNKKSSIDFDFLEFELCISVAICASKYSLRVSESIGLFRL